MAVRGRPVPRAFMRSGSGGAVECQWACRGAGSASSLMGRPRPSRARQISPTSWSRKEASISAWTVLSSVWTQNLTKRNLLLRALTVRKMAAVFSLGTFRMSKTRMATLSQSSSKKKRQRMVGMLSPL